MANKSPPSPIRMLMPIFRVVLFLAISVSTFFSTGFVAEGLAANGTSAFDVVVIVLCGATFFAALTALHQVGINVLPMLHGAEFARCAKVWALIAAIAIPVSFQTGLQYVGEPIAKATEIENARAAAQKNGADAVAEVRVLRDLASMARTQANNAESMKERELRFGSISGLGGGSGVTVNALASVADLLHGAASALGEANARSQPPARQIERLIARLRDLADAPDISRAERARKTKALVAEMNKLVEATRRMAPLTSMRALVEGLSVDWESLGLNNRAAGIMRESFAPTAKQFDDALAAFGEEAVRPAAQFIERSGLDLLSEHIPEILPIAAFLLLLDTLPLLNVFLVVSLSRRPQPSTALLTEAPGDSSAKPNGRDRSAGRRLGSRNSDPSDHDYN